MRKERADFGAGNTGLKEPGIQEPQHHRTHTGHGNHASHAEERGMLHRHQVPYKHIGQTSHHIRNQKAQVAVGPAVPPHLGVDIEHVPRGHEAHGRQCKLHASLRPGQSHTASGEHPQHHDGYKSQHAKVIAHELQFPVPGFHVSAGPLQRRAQRLALCLVCVLHVLTFLTKTNFFDKSAAKNPQARFFFPLLHRKLETRHPAATPQESSTTSSTMAVRPVKDWWNSSVAAKPAPKSSDGIQAGTFF